MEDRCYHVTTQQLAPVLRDSETRSATDVLCVGIMHTRSNAALKRGAWRTGVGRGTEGGRCTASTDAQRGVAQCLWFMQRLLH